MNILERKIIHEQTTLCSCIVYPQFVLPRHRHAEYELMLFTRGRGKEFVGEGVLDYQAGDVALIGSNVPHLHLCYAKLYPGEGYEPSAGEALQFHPALFPSRMDELPDYHSINTLLARSQQGLRFFEKGLYDELLARIHALDGLEYTGRIIGLLQILERLGQCRDVRLLSDVAYNRANDVALAADPVSRVYDYLFNHFKDEVTLQDVADYVRLNRSALCRYFRQHTDKSIFQCLARIRVDHACKLLAYSNLNISQIAYESGYNSVPYFIRQFKELTHLTPSDYRCQLAK